MPLTSVRMAIVCFNLLMAVTKYPTEATQGKRVCLGSWATVQQQSEGVTCDAEAQVIVVGTRAKAVHVTANEEAEAGETRPLVTRRISWGRDKPVHQGMRTERCFRQALRTRSCRGSFLSTTSKGLNPEDSLPCHVVPGADPG